LNPDLDPQNTEARLLAATRLALDLDADTDIPVRGHPAGEALPQRALRFLTAIYEGTVTGYDAGLTDFDIARKLKDDLAEYQQWYDFAKLGGVVSEMYLQVEQERF
jgi:hypothetical protein